MAITVKVDFEIPKNHPRLLAVLAFLGELRTHGILSTVTQFTRDYVPKEAYIPHDKLETRLLQALGTHPHVGDTSEVLGAMKLPDTEANRLVVEALIDSLIASGAVLRKTWYLVRRKKAKRPKKAVPAPPKPTPKGLTKTDLRVLEAFSNFRSMKIVNVARYLKLDKESVQKSAYKLGRKGLLVNDGGGHWKAPSKESADSG